MRRAIHQALIGLSGLCLAVGGAWLLRLGGSVVCLLQGLALLLLALRYGRSEAAWGYLVFLGLSFLWAFGEVGWDGWALLPRLGYFLLLGIPFLWQLAGRRTSSLQRKVLVLLVAAIVIRVCLPNSVLPDPVERMGRVTEAPSELSKVSEVTDPDWPVVGHDAGGTRHSALQGLDVTNAGQLEEAWRYSVGSSEVLEVTPLAIDGRLYLCDGNNDVIALDGASGRELWRYDSGAVHATAVLKACRGVAYVRVPQASETCAQRILTNTVDAHLIALDAITGTPCEQFGEHGKVSLLTGMGDWQGRTLPGYYAVTSAPTVVGDRVILGGWVSDAQYWGEPSGVIRAYDVVTGRFAWAFDMGRPADHAEPPNGQHYTPSTPNAWAPMAADEILGLVYVPTGNTSGSDYYGVRRREFDERYSSSVIALDARSGDPRWTFQTVHHDLWDYDVAPQPVLTELSVGGVMTPALLQATKTGEVFVLDRRTGVPIRPVTERKAPRRSVVAGEVLSPTQPESSGMPGFAGPALTEAMMWGLTPFDQLYCRLKFRQSRYEGAYTPPDTRPFLEYPGILGGIEWSSVSVDPGRHLVFVDASRMANLARLIPRAEADREGRRPEGLGGHYMHRAQAGTPYAVSNPYFLSPLGVPCQQPPYGTLSAVDLTTGQLVWHQRLGSARASGPFGVASGLPLPLGTPHLGGTFNTASGVLVTAAGQDHRLRLYASATGRLLAEYPLPAVSVATPMTFLGHDRRQYLIVVAGNQDPRLGKTGDSVIAFRVPTDLQPESSP